MGKFVGTITGIARNHKVYNGVVKFAISYRQKESGQYVDKWANVVLFGKMGERFTEYAGDGCIVMATGSISLNSYTKSDGNTVYSVELIASDFDIIQKAGVSQASPAQAARPKPDRSHATKPQQPNRQPAPPPVDDFSDDSDVPF